MNCAAIRWKPIVLFLAILVTSIGLFWGWCALARWRAEQPVRELHAQAGSLFEAFRKYREHTGRYPSGNNAEIARALSGKNEQRGLILVMRKHDANDRGEMVDPWGTPLRFYFSSETVLIRSAGPNQRFDEGRPPSGDDYFIED